MNSVYFSSLGFKEQIYDVYRYLPPSTQVWIVSLPRCAALIRAHLLGCPGECHPSTRDPGDDMQIYDRPNPDLGQTVST